MLLEGNLLHQKPTQHTCPSQTASTRQCYGVWCALFLSFQRDSRQEAKKLNLANVASGEYQKWYWIGPIPGTGASVIPVFGSADAPNRLLKAWFRAGAVGNSVSVPRCSAARRSNSFPPLPRTLR